MDDSTDAMRKWLSVMELAEKLGNVAEACRQFGIDQTSFYKMRKRFRTHGIEGLKHLAPIHRSHPQTTPPETVQRILDLALQHPSCGCDRIEEILALDGVRLSAITVQKILKNHGLGGVHDRWQELEKRQAEASIELTGEQMAFVQKQNPCFRERHNESSTPGELLFAQAFRVPHALKGHTRPWMYAVVDTFGSYAFAFLRKTKSSGSAEELLDENVLPFYRELDLPIGAALSGNPPEFWGRLPFSHDATTGTDHLPQIRANGFMDRFRATVMGEFFRVSTRDRLHSSFEAQRAALDTWLVHYNTERPHLGYPNYGRTPVEVIRQFLTGEG